MDLDGIELSGPYFQSLLKDAGNRSLEEIANFLFEELPYLWRESYIEKSQRPVNLRIIQENTFKYIYDEYESLVYTKPKQSKATN